MCVFENSIITVCDRQSRRWRLAIFFRQNNARLHTPKHNLSNSCLTETVLILPLSYSRLLERSIRKSWLARLKKKNMKDGRRERRKERQGRGEGKEGGEFDILRTAWPGAMKVCKSC